MSTIAAILVNAHGGKADKIKPSARPKTAFEEARRDLAKSKHKALVARMKKLRSQVD